MPDNEKLEAPGTKTMTRPSFIKEGDRRGTEHITKDDLQIARLALAQGLTPQVAEGKTGHDVNDAEVPFTSGVLFNSQSEVIYGKGPLQFVILRGDRPRWVQFRPREEGGGVIDMNVPGNDPRTRFTIDPENPKTSIKPLATKFYDFVICLYPIDKVDPMKSVIGLSFKSSALKVAKELNTLVTYRNAPLFAGIYSVRSIVDPNRTKGIFNNFEVDNAGWIEDEETYKLMEGLYKSLADKTITVDRTGEEPIDETDFPGDRQPGEEG